MGYARAGSSPAFGTILLLYIFPDNKIIYIDLRPITHPKFSFLKVYSTADVAQSVEQLIRNQQVSGSTPLVGSIYLFKKKGLCKLSASPFFLLAHRDGAVILNQ